MASLGASVHAQPLRAAVQHRALGPPRDRRDQPDAPQRRARARRQRQQRVCKRAAAAELRRVQLYLLRAQGQGAVRAQQLPVAQCAQKQAEHPACRTCVNDFS